MPATPHALIIDDDGNNLKVLQQLLRLSGVTYTSVQNTSTIHQIIDSLNPVKVVFLDLEMPDVDGYEIFQLLKSHPNFQNTPVVACTVHSAEFRTAREMGFHSFISKPLDAEIFAEQLNLILNGIPVWQVV